MLVKQVSVFIENKKGRLSEIADTLAQNNIDISALSLAENAEYGILRMIVSDAEKAKTVLTDSGVIVKITEVLAVVMDDQPGGFANALHQMTDHGIEVKYMYACISHEKGKALMILSVSDLKMAEQLIDSSGAIDPKSVYRI